MDKLTSIFAPLLIVVSSPLMIQPSQAAVAPPNKSICFQTVDTGLLVPKLLTLKQKDYLKIMPVPKSEMPFLVFNYSLQNNIKKCLANGKKINGFAPPVELTRPPQNSNVRKIEHYIATVNQFRLSDDGIIRPFKISGSVLVSTSKSNVVTVISRMEKI